MRASSSFSLGVLVFLMTSGRAMFGSITSNYQEICLGALAIDNTKLVEENDIFKRLRLPASVYGPGSVCT